MSKTTSTRLAGFTTDAVLSGIEEQHGGFLRCETCRRCAPVIPESGPSYFKTGWPKCCGYTMSWWTARQIRDGEVPA